VCRERGWRQLESIAKFADRQPIRTGLHQRAIRAQSVFMGERTQRYKSGEGIHNSIIPELSNYCNQCSVSILT